MRKRRVPTRSWPCYRRWRLGRRASSTVPTASDLDGRRGWVPPRDAKRSPSASATSIASVSPTEGIGCNGNCDDSEEVSVDEIVRLVNIALGGGSVDECLAGDGNGDALITVEEILQAVINAQTGCP